jgi:hypothetical protein
MQNDQHHSEPPEAVIECVLFDFVLSFFISHLPKQKIPTQSRASVELSEPVNSLYVAVKSSGHDS